jgi:hypothetical protein
MLDQEVQTFSQIIASITDGVSVSASDVRQVCFCFCFLLRLFCVLIVAAL